MKLRVNGDERSFEGVGDVAALVRALGLDARKIAVELNLNIVPRSTYAAAQLSDGDQLEIVQYFGGV
jgi:thiamine biosynthesis protein ThiS